MIRYFRRATSSPMQVQSAYLSRWSLVMGLIVALTISLFHDLPAVAGTDPTGLAIVSIATGASPEQIPESQPAGLACACCSLCHIAPAALSAPAGIPVFFNGSRERPRSSTAPPSCSAASLFRPPRI